MGSYQSNSARYQQKCLDTYSCPKRYRNDDSIFLLHVEIKGQNFDARVVNSPTSGIPESRSAWARNLDVDDLIHVKENAPIAVGYYYQAEISSDFFTYGDVDVDLAFSPDYMSDTSEIPSTPDDLT